ncbi:hypothetical protein QQX98_006172 [Neonectria punicea]|uniref:Prion-inhibition and propagation HeLo domain-containing protein n=1 Tax=Neonectria punicea TaxID=979145 RepID=A0ABR1H1R5_9HYPO
MGSISTMSTISTLLSTVIHEFQCIQISRSFGGDFKLYQAQPAILQLRLSRWAEAAGLNKDFGGNDEGSGDAKKSQIPKLVLKGGPNQINHVEDLLCRAKAVLEKAKKDSLESKPEDNDKKSASFESNGDDPGPPRFRRLDLKIQELVKKRRPSVATHVEDIKWTVYNREQWESFTTAILEIFDELETFIEPQSKLKELSLDDSKAIDDSLDTLLEVIGKCDPRLQEAAMKTLQGQEDSPKVSFSATYNYGQQVGVIRSEMRGMAFGNYNTINNTW